MNIAAVKNGIVIDAHIFDNMQTAEEFLNESILDSADTVAELPEGYGIGDHYQNGKWKKKDPPVLQPESTEESLFDEVTSLQIAIAELYEMILGGSAND